MAMVPQTLYLMNMFVDGINFSGDVPTLSLPKLKIKTDEYRAGGMDIGIDMDQGMEKMEASFSTRGVRREAMKFSALPIRLHSTRFFGGRTRRKGQHGRGGCHPARHALGAGFRRMEAG